MRHSRNDCARLWKRPLLDEERRERSKMVIRTMPGHLKKSLLERRTVIRRDRLKASP